MTRLLAMLLLAGAVCAAMAQDDTSTTDTTTTITTPSQTVTIGPFMTSHNLSWEDAAAAIAIAQATGMQPEVVLTDRPTTVTTSYYDLAPAYVIAHESNQPVSAIIDLYNGGQTWMQIANKYNVPATVWNPDNADISAWTNTDFENALWRHILMTNYNMTEGDYGYFQSQHVPWNEVVVAQVYGRETNHPIRDVWTTYSNGGSQWTTVQTTYTQVIPSTTTTETTQTTTTTEETQVTPPPPVTNETQTTSSYTSTTSSRPMTTISRSTKTRSYARHYTASRHRFARRSGTRALRFSSRRRHTTRHTRRHSNCCCCCK